MLNKAQQHTSVKSRGGLSSAIPTAIQQERTARRRRASNERLVKHYISLGVIDATQAAIVAEFLSEGAA